MPTLKNKYFLFLVALMVAYGLFEYYRPKPLDWSPTYSNKDKIPFGSKALFELLPEVFPTQPVQSLRLPIYNQLTEHTLPPKSNYVFVCQSFEINHNDRQLLLDYVKKGNHAFISAYDFSDSLLNPLGVKAELKAPTLRDTALVMNFTSPDFRQNNGYVFSQDDGRNYFKILKSDHVTTLAQNARNEPIFVKVKYGKGAFLLHNLPLALTNYYVLKPETSDFAFKSLSYLPVAPMFWDEYLKQGRFGDDERSPLRYILTQPPLRWAYYLSLFGLLLYAIFAGKRTQRAIPLIEPPQNTSLEFVRTIGQMYYQQGNHGLIAEKKIQYLMMYIRERFGLKFQEFDEELKHELLQRTGLSKLDIELLFGEIAHAQRWHSLSEYELLSLNRRIEEFYKATK
ncbi:MAG: DUF4350 domain-containing protein [Runella sp.]